ncbi:partial Sensor protein ZraS, partial [Anaerolineae bacterium]
KKSGYSTQTVLCMPMRNREGVIIGVFQLLNKRTGHFGPEDEAFIDALSVHAAIALENAQLARQMVESERLSAVGRMASSILHDIKNPLSTLRLYADIIRRGSQTQDPAQIADQMIRQIDRFNDMAQEILDFAHGVSEISIEQVELGQVLDPLVRFIEADLASHKVTLVRDIQYTGPCQLDMDKLARAVYNLTSNAVDAMAEGGTLTLSTAAANGHMVIGIGDTGPGIPEEVRARMFEPFFTHGKRHGTGLGLSIVKKIMDEHRGRVEVESAVGKGTTFRLFFPL